MTPDAKFPGKTLAQGAPPGTAAIPRRCGIHPVAERALPQPPATQADAQITPAGAAAFSSIWGRADARTADLERP